jgi:hypothetical protein
VAGDIGVALVVREEENDVRLFAREAGGMRGERESEKEDEDAYHEASMNAAQMAF